MRPDIVIDWGPGEAGGRLILDTKWKIPRDSKPDDADLKQMYVYNLHFGAGRSVLVYPAAEGMEASRKPFRTSDALPDGHTHDCQLYFAGLFDEADELDSRMGDRMLSDLVPIEGLVTG